MDCVRNSFAAFLILSLASFMPAQEKQTKPAAKPAVAQDVDPLALDVLRAVVQPLQQAQTFSFKALVSEEDIATNGQVITFFHTVDVMVQRPDKLRLVFRGQGQRVDYYFSNGTITMYAPDANLYSTQPAKPTIDAALADAYERGVDMPIAPFLRSDLYNLATAKLFTGYVIGRVKVFDTDVHQLAFTAPDADWQLWVTGGDAPRIVRVEAVSKLLDGKPRTIIQFRDWDLHPTIGPDEFTFTKPEGAQKIDVMTIQLPVRGATK
jgi:hypothetical protein